MRTVFNIAKNELRQLFCSPIAWILLVIFYVQTGHSGSLRGKLHRSCSAALGQEYTLPSRRGSISIFLFLLWVL